MPGGIEIKTRDEIAYMREASLIVFEVLEELTRAAAPGVTLEDLEDDQRGLVAAASAPSRACTAFPRTSASRSTSRWSTASPPGGSSWKAISSSSTTG